ncbi:MAG: hypothetical protein QOF14_1118 [Hyphomicrobiales bacterium]|nr:hypothetical protein [Hyphomicrobiales bacterium]
MTRDLLALTLVAVLASSDVSAMEYKGLCEASAGAFLDDTHFAVASDETNVLQIYQRGKPEPLGSGVDMEPFTSFDKSDLEGAARIGDRIYWISSHSFNSSGEDKAKRKVFFATTIGSVDGKPTLKGVGKPIKTLRDPLATAAGVAPHEMNIEALSATPQGGLLIGLRKPLRDGMALVIPLKNPGPVVDNEPPAPPDFGTVIPLDLEGRGLRSMDLIGSGGEQYVIVAGPVEDSAEGFAIFRWAGPGSKPVKVEGPNLKGLTPEGAMAVPGQDLVQLLSDDGKVNGVTCSDEHDPVEKRKFRSIDVKP